MRKTRKRKYIIYSLLVLTIIFLLYTFIFEEVNRWLTYGAIFFFGYLLTMVFSDFALYDYTKKIEWLENRLKL